MIKTVFKAMCLIAALAFVFAPMASAHEIWATAENPTAGQPLVGILGYGHDFPHGEEIAAERVSIFFPLDILNAKGEKLATKAGDKNYIFITEEPVQEGTYLLLTGYKPTFWSYTPEGSVMKAKNETPGATSCEQYSRFAKGVINIGAAADDFVTKPVGNKLEIVPLVNPGKVKVGGDLPLQVLNDGKPLAKATVKGTLEGNKYQEDGNRDFLAVTNDEGKFTMSPIKDGLWTLVVEVKSDYPDKAVCDDLAADATLTFTIPK
ncbi:MAG: DUF4198 domain-containing protein [Deltaproteobacteria bacterium]|jgi:uncharacterized GH25 family protein|nr:DUF4198 domain-containing protein [Deltaproteobacteria bacterium]